MKKYTWYILILIGVLSSCKKDEPVNNQDVVIPDDLVLVLNEGNYTYGNASITMYDGNMDTTRQNLFQSVNDILLGDVVQSMAFKSGRGFIVVNNSGKIEVVTMNDFRSLATITGLTSPRYMLPLWDDRAYVTDLYAEKIAIIDLVSFSITGYLDMPGWTEQLQQVEDYVYIANYDSSRVEVVDWRKDSIVARIPVAGHPVAVATRWDSLVYVSTEKDLNGDGTATITSINTNTWQPTVLKTFSGSGNASGMVMDVERNKLYYINGSQVVQASLSPFSETTLLTRPGTNWYALKANWTGEELYITDARDYNQNGQVLRLNIATQTLIDSFEAGVIPGNVYFY